jgi:hypothetical protein
MSFGGYHRRIGSSVSDALGVVCSSIARVLFAYLGVMAIAVLDRLARFLSAGFTPRYPIVGDAAFS